MTFTDFTQLSDAALVEAIRPAREASPALHEYLKRMEARLASQRDLTKLILQVIALPCLPVVDLEATCFGKEERHSYPMEVIEVGWALLEPATGRLLDSKQFYVKPTVGYVSEFCTELTGITPETVANAPTFTETMVKLAALHQDYDIPMWSSFGAYDQKMLKTQCEAEGVAYPWQGQRYFNIKELGGAYFGSGKKSPGLARAMARAGLEFEGRHHSGVDDARNTARLLAHMLGR